MNKNTYEKMRRVVITGLGIISPAGLGKESFWDVMSNGKSCVNWITRFNTENTRVKIAAEIKKQKLPKYPKPMFLPDVDLVSHYSLIAAHIALKDSELEIEENELERCGISIGTSAGGLDEAAQWYHELLQISTKGNKVDINPTLADRLCYFPGSLAENINVTYGFKGISNVISTGCTASADAIGYAFEVIRRDQADIMLAGGTEAPINLFTIKAFDAINALSTRAENPQKASRPFDKERDGFVMGEGAAILVLDELEHAKSRGAHIYCEIAGYQTTCDAFHVTGSDPELRQACRAIEQALSMANLNPDDVDYVNAHGTSTPMNDRAETSLIKKVFGKHTYNLPISSIKSMIGHGSGAAGAMQAVSCALMFEHNMLAPTINYEFPDPECDLDYVPNHARKWEGRVILQNTFGFSGKNSALIYVRYEE